MEKRETGMKERGERDRGKREHRERQLKEIDGERRGKTEWRNTVEREKKSEEIEVKERV